MSLFTRVKAFTRIDSLVVWSLNLLEVSIAFLDMLLNDIRKTLGISFLVSPCTFLYFALHFGCHEINWVVINLNVKRLCLELIFGRQIGREE